MGQAEQRIIRQCYARRKSLPDRIEHAPDLLLGLELYFNAFTELNTCRNSGWGAGPIPSWCIGEYCDRLGLTPDESEDMYYHIRKLDEAFLKYNARKNKEKS
jgi:hypothetical protein